MTHFDRRHLRPRRASDMTQQELTKYHNKNQVIEIVAAATLVLVTAIVVISIFSFNKNVTHTKHQAGEATCAVLDSFLRAGKQLIFFARKDVIAEAQRRYIAAINTNLGKALGIDPPGLVTAAGVDCNEFKRLSGLH